ncbi:SGNH/GDSL hydrolase family protein [Jatrophihabitans sp. YIM 134969]
MSRASRARRVAIAAAYGGGSLGALGALGAAFYGVIVGETKLARRRIPAADGDPPSGDGITWTAPSAFARHRGRGGEPLRMAMLGDSTAAGYGVHRDVDTPGVQLAMRLSAVAGRPVQLTSVAVVGAESSGLVEQVERALPHRPDLAVIMVGANDVTHRIQPSESIRHLSDAVRTLRESGAQVVVGTCPDLGTIRPIAQPLRLIARRMSRTLAAAQTIAVVENGGRTVSLADMVGPGFAKNRDWFAADQFHPSAEGYRAAVEAVLPSAVDALGLATNTEPATLFTSDRARPVAKAAARAANNPGTEVLPAEVAGSARGRRGRWARILRRQTTDEVPAPPAGDDDHDQVDALAPTNQH